MTLPGTSNRPVQGGRLPPAQRNSNPGSLLNSFQFGGDIIPNPAEELFKFTTTEQLIAKSDIPEKMVPIVGRMLWTARQYRIPIREEMVRWYCIARIGKDRTGRWEYKDMVMGLRKSEEDDAGI